jgi:hypothetical protein
MTNSTSKINLTVQERRIVFGIVAVVFIVLNGLLVWPHFGDWDRINRQLDTMRQTEERYNTIIQKDLSPKNGWKLQVAKLAHQEGNAVKDSAVDPQNELQTTVYQQEKNTGVPPGSSSPGSVKTNNEFFEEHSISISVQSQEPQLVNFLYNMGMDPAMIRVAKLDLRPEDQNRYRLKGTITLTANYAKQATPAAGKTVPGAKPGAGGGAKPAAASAPKPPGAPGSKPAAPNHPPGGPPVAAPGNGRQPAGGAKPLPLGRPVPAPGQKAAN